MDFDKAIKAHSDWKMKLAVYLKKPDGSLKAGELGQDNKCELGSWITAEGPKHNGSPEFAKLKAEHTRFHKAAADVVRRADSGKNVSEETVLGAKSEFMSASQGVVQAILTMKAKA
jgi:methyl-accepting chemotaxis protein